MRNKGKSKISGIFETASKLPYFTVVDLASMEADKQYLRVLLSRYSVSGKAVRLKKGMYVAQEYIRKLEIAGTVSRYPEFVSNILYTPSYLSLEYVLYKHNILTEVPVNFTSVSTKKTSSFTNAFGTFIYHSMRGGLFTGFEAVTEGGLTLRRASKAKALFDFLYYRKNNIADKRATEELRLNLGELNSADKKELMQYINIEGSKKMKLIYEYLFN